ncbi:MAG: hypothetical protein V2I48_03950 [Xanthomonadales bacterium]|jgi:hypothetical protein|nr:hypothetical protein [Xanthomonadales bacterium]
MALLTGLLLLAAVSLLAITAAGTMTLQQHQSANFADKTRARSKALLAESFARAWLYSRADSERASSCTANCLLPPGIYHDEDIPDNPEFKSMAWWRDHGVPAGGSPGSGPVTGYVGEKPMESLWVMEELHFEPVDDDSGETGYSGVGYYRIFSRGSGNGPASVVTCEAIVARPWGGEFRTVEFPPQAPLSRFCSQFSDAGACGTLAWRMRR